MLANMSEWSADTARVLIDRFLESLRELPAVHAQLKMAERISDRSARVDAEVELSIPGKSVTLLIEAKKAAYPRDVRQVLWQFKTLSLGDATPVQHLLVAESLSPGAKELLRAERIGYYDSGGSLFLPVPGAYIFIDKPPLKNLQKSVQSFFPAGGRRCCTHFW